MNWTDLAKQWGGFGIIVVGLCLVVGFLFKLLIKSQETERGLLIKSQETERAQWATERAVMVAERDAMQVRLDKSYEQNDKQNETFNQQVRDILEGRLKETREFFREQVTLSNTVVSSTLSTKDAMVDVKDQMKALQEDYQDQNGFVKGLLERLAKDKA